MADKKKQYETELLNAIKDNKIAFLDHAFAFVSFSSSTSYNYELEKLETIKEALKNNRVKAKNYLLNKWIASPNATLNVAAYRLLSTSEEHKLLNQQYHDHTSNGESIKKIEFEIIDPKD